jgi:hypothetical protein
MEIPGEQKWLWRKYGSLTTVSIVVPPGSDWVRIRLQAFQNGGSDYAAFDNVRVVNNEAGDTTPPEVVEGGF